MCLNKSLLLFLTRVKGKIYFAPEREILHFLPNSPVNQEELETSAWRLRAFLLFAKLKGGLSFAGGCACAKQQDQCRRCAIQRKGTLRGPRMGGMPRTLCPPAGCTCVTALHASHCHHCLRSRWLWQGSPSTHKPRTYFAQQRISKYFDIKSVPR